MNRFNTFIILLASIVLSVFLSGCYRNDDKGKLTINNSTDEIIVTVKLDYKNNEDVLIKSIEPGKKYVHEILDATDDSIKLVFKDSKGNNYEQIVVGYVTRGIEDVDVNITKGDDGRILIYVDN